MTEPAWRLLVLLLCAGAFSGAFAAGVEAMLAASISGAKLVAGVAALCMLTIAAGFVGVWLL